MNSRTLKIFNDLMGIGASHDYEAHSGDDGILTGKVVSGSNSSLVEVSMSGMPSNLDLYTSGLLLEKYLDFFPGNVDIRTNETTILLADDKTEALVPMTAKESAVRNTRALKRSPDYSNALVANMSVDDFKFAFKVSSKFEEYTVKFEMGDYLTISVGNFKRNLRDITGAPGKWFLKYDLMEEILKHAPGEIQVSFNYDFDLPADNRAPVKFEYVNGAIHVIAYVMRLDIND